MMRVGHKNMRLSTCMCSTCTISVGLISRRLVHMTFGLLVSIQATDIGFRLAFRMAEKGFKYIREYTIS